MKRKVFILGLILLITGISNCYAKVWRVNSNPDAKANYTILNDAINVAGKGDTIYLEPSPISYGSISLSKPLVIMGAGYFLNENPETQDNLYNSEIVSISFNPGSQGSEIWGLYIGRNNTDHRTIIIQTDSIKIIRNYIVCFYSNDNAIEFYNPNRKIKNIFIEQNYIPNHGIASSYNGSGLQNILIKNNYIYNLVLYAPIDNAFIENNIIKVGLTISNARIKNNILIGSFTDNKNIEIAYNISVGAGFGNLNNNQNNIAQSSLFIGATGNSTDGQWQLSTSSPAKGSGQSGEDCGMFGGFNPYVLSGLPPIPAIYKFDLINNPNDSLKLNISIKAHK